MVYNIIMKKKVAIFTCLFLALDQISKIIFNSFFTLGESVKIFDKFLYITLAYNDGVAFSMLTGKKWFIILLCIAILSFLIIYMPKFKKNKRNILAFSLVFGGLIGNLLDRIIHGYVIDFIDFHILGYDYPIFNFADSFVFIGICLLMWSIYLGEDNDSSKR